MLRSLGDTLANILFQFHKGAIRTLLRSLLVLPLTDFNSIKVRLEPFPAKILPLYLAISIP